MDKKVKIARELVKLAKSLMADQYDEEKKMLGEYLSFFKRDFEYSDNDVTVVFKDKTNGSLYGDYSIEVIGDCANPESFVNNINSSFGQYFRKEVERNLQEEMDSSTFIAYQNTLMEEEGLSEDEAASWASEKLCTFMAESNWGNAGPNPGKIYCNGEEVGEFDFFGLLHKCCIRW